jgi:hypothetical protein
MLWRDDSLHGDFNQGFPSHDSFQRLWRAAIHLSALQKISRNSSLIRQIKSLIPPC